MPRTLRAGDLGADVRALQDALTSERATSTPLFQMQGAFSLGFDGRF